MQITREAREKPPGAMRAALLLFHWNGGVVKWNCIPRVNPAQTIPRCPPLTALATGGLFAYGQIAATHRPVSTSQITGSGNMAGAAPAGAGQHPTGAGAGAMDATPTRHSLAALFWPMFAVSTGHHHVLVWNPVEPPSRQWQTT